MKKFLACLLVFVFVVAGIFATSETHTLKIKADVTEVIPAFQLELLAPAATATTNTASNVFGTEAAYNPLTTETAKDVNFNLDENGTVTVQCNLANHAKTTKSYTLTFGGGDFAVKKNKANATHSPSSVVSAAGANVANVYTITRAEGEGNQVITVAFHGKTVTSDSAVLATCVYSYTADSAIDPTAGGEYYYADITLTIATV